MKKLSLDQMAAVKGGASAYCTAISIAATGLSLFQLYIISIPLYIAALICYANPDYDGGSGSGGSGGGGCDNCPYPY